MLLVTGKGHYFTVVEHKDDPELLLVRSQDRESIEHVISVLRGKGMPGSELELIDEPDWDYQFRVIIPRPIFMLYLDQVVGEIDYPKVKPAVAKARGANHPISKMVNEVFYYMSENRPDGSLPAWLGGRAR